MPPTGKKIGKFVHNIESGAVIQPNESASTLRVKEAEALILSSPVPEPPEVPQRPARYRTERTPPPQQEQTPPSSPQDAFHLQRGERAETQIPQRQQERLLTPENSTLSTNFSSINESSTPLHDIRAQVSKLESEVESLRTEVGARREAEISLRNDLDEANRKRDQILSDLQASRQEKDHWQDTAERLRRQLTQERETITRLEEDIHAGIKREVELRDMLERRMRIEESMPAAERKLVETQGANAPRVEEQPRGQRSERKRAQINIHVHEKSESRVSWDSKFSSKDKKKGGKYRLARSDS